MGAYLYTPPFFPRRPSTPLPLAPARRRPRDVRALDLVHQLPPPRRVQHEGVEVRHRVGDAPVPRPGGRPPPRPVVHARRAQRGQHARRQHRLTRGREADGCEDGITNEDDFMVTACWKQLQRALYVKAVLS